MSALTEQQLAALTDAALQATRHAVMDEITRRGQLSTIPGQVERMADEYDRAGGSRDDLVNKVQTPPEGTP